MTIPAVPNEKLEHHLIDCPKRQKVLDALVDAKGLNEHAVTRGEKVPYSEAKRVTKVALKAIKGVEKDPILKFDRDAIGDVTDLRRELAILERNTKFSVRKVAGKVVKFGASSILAPMAIDAGLKLVLPAPVAIVTSELLPKEEEATATVAQASLKLVKDYSGKKKDELASGAIKSMNKGIEHLGTGAIEVGLAVAAVKSGNLAKAGAELYLGAKSTCKAVKHFGRMFQKLVARKTAPIAINPRKVFI